MNKTKYLQTDSRWGGLGYPKAPWYIRNCGCGEVSICNVIIEMEQYKNYTPATIQPYCKQYAAPNGDGTYWSGIPAMMKHYGLTEVKEHATMDKLWKELAKGDRVAIYLMGSRPGGSKKVHWTSGGHFVSSVSYMYKENKHYVYMKDSASNSSLRNGWITYEENIKGDCLKVWTGKLNGAKPSPTPEPTPTPTPTPKGKLTVDGVGGKATVKRMQEFFKTPQDGIIGGQVKSRKPYYPSLTAVSFGGGGSQCVIALQKWLGLSGPDGVIGPNTTKAWQKKLRSLGYFDNPKEPIDGIFGVKSMKAWQECLNNDGKKKGNTPTPTPDPKPTPSKTYLKVIDISEFQSNIDWKKIKADGVKGAIIRCGYRGAISGKLNPDDMFLKHIKGAHAAGVPVGIYMFTQAINSAEGKAEADYAIKQWESAGVPISFPIAVDTEALTVDGKPGRANNISVAKRTEAIKAFCEQIKAKGYTPMIYASTSWLNNKLDMSKLPYDVWCAQYYSKCEYKGKYIIWQYTSEGKVDGIKGNVDLNHCYIEPKEVWPRKVDPTPTPSKTKQQKMSEWARKIAKDNTYHYKTWTNDVKTHQCPICKNLPVGKYHGWNCIGFVFAVWHHGASLKSKCNCGVISNGVAEKMLQMSDSDLQKEAKKRVGIDDIKAIRNKKGIPKSEWEEGDICMQFSGNSYQHMFYYVGNGKIIDAASASMPVDKQIAERSYSKYSAKIILRYTGK